MFLFEVMLILAAVTVIIWWAGSVRSGRSETSPIRIPTLLLSGWLISAAVFAGHFYTLRIPGFFDITIERIFFILLISTLVVGFLTGRISWRETTGFEILLLVFVLFCLISMLRTGFLPLLPQYPSPWYSFISGYLFPFVVFLYAKYYLKDPADIRFILYSLYGIGAYLSIIAALEFFSIREFIFPSYIADPKIELHLGRARGPFLNAAVNGTAILFGLICALYATIQKQGFFRIISICFLSLFLVSVFFTLTRSVYLGLILVLFIFAAWCKTSFPKWKLLSIPLAIVLIVVMFNFPRFLSSERREGGVYQTEEVKIRLALIMRSVDMILDNPVTGVGFSQFIPASVRSFKGRLPYLAESEREQMQHNHLLGLGVELGVLGLLVYLGIILLLFRRIFQLKAILPSSGVLGDNFRIVVLAIWAVYLCTNFFIEPSPHLFMNAVPFLFAGIADGVYSRSRETVRESAVVGSLPAHV